MTSQSDDLPFKVHNPNPKDPNKPELMKAFSTNEEAHAFRRELATKASEEPVKAISSVSKIDK